MMPDELQTSAGLHHESDQRRLLEFLERDEREQTHGAQDDEAIRVLLMLLLANEG